MFHVLNRGVGRMKIFLKDQDYVAFEELVAETLRLYPMADPLGYCLMPNSLALPSFLWLRARWRLVRLLAATHQYPIRNVGSEPTTGSASGHLYQGRFKSFPPVGKAGRSFLFRRSLRGAKLRRGRTSSSWRRVGDGGVCGGESTMPAPRSWYLGRSPSQRSGAGQPTADGGRIGGDPSVCAAGMSIGRRGMGGADSESSGVGSNASPARSSAKRPGYLTSRCVLSPNYAPDTFF